MKTVKIPNADHPIAIEPSRARVRVTVGGQVIADTRDALRLREGGYDPVLYLPRAAFDMTVLARSETQSYCPYKGDASHYSIPRGGERAVDAVWTYEAPYPAVAEIKEFLAFYPDRVDSIEELPLS